MLAIAEYVEQSTTITEYVFDFTQLNYCTGHLSTNSLDSLNCDLGEVMMYHALQLKNNRQFSLSLVRQPVRIYPCSSESR